jgi:hypothetical protein
LPVFSGRVEHFLEKLDELFGVVNHDSRRNRAPAFRNEMR